jgi:membrane protease YdiL (CAAX protease family)
MIPPMLSLTVIGLVVVAHIASVGRERACQNRTWIGLFLAVYFLDNLIIVTTNLVPQLQFVPNGIWQGWLTWGWSGKVYSVIACLVLAFLVRGVLSRQDLGLTLRQNPGSFKPALIVLGMMGIWSAYLGISYPKGPFDPGVLLYMAILPGLNEELVYRGFLLGALNRVLGKSWIVFGANLGHGAFITSLLFGLLHGFWFDSNLTPHIDLLAVAVPGVLGFVDAWLRERTGSLVMPILTHGVEDLTIFFFRMV